MPNTVRISSGFENEWRFGVRASVLECGSPVFPLPTSFRSACAGLSGPTARLHTSLGQRPRTSDCEAFSAIPLWIKDLGRCPTAIKLSLESLVTRARSQAPAWECSILGGSSLLPDLQKHSAPERNGRLEPPRQGRSQAGAWERDREFLNLMAVGRCPRLLCGRAFGAETQIHRLVGNGKIPRRHRAAALQDAGAFLETPNAIRCELHSLSSKFVKRTVLGILPALPSVN